MSQFVKLYKKFTPMLQKSNYLTIDELQFGDTNSNTPDLSFLMENIKQIFDQMDILNET